MQNKDWRDEALEMAWVVIANAGGGNWKTESDRWQTAAAKWREDYFDNVSKDRRNRASRFPKDFHDRQYRGWQGCQGSQGYQGAQGMQGVPCEQGQE